MMAVSALLKLCATPPASCPTLSRRCAFRSRSSSIRVSVTSSIIATAKRRRPARSRVSEIAVSASTVSPVFVTYRSWSRNTDAASSRTPAGRSRRVARLLGVRHVDERLAEELVRTVAEHRAERIVDLHETPILPPPARCRSEPAQTATGNVARSRPRPPPRVCAP